LQMKAAAGSSRVGVSIMARALEGGVNTPQIVSRAFPRRNRSQLSDDDGSKNRMVPASPSKPNLNKVVYSGETQRTCPNVTNSILAQHDRHSAGNRR
jgi:hypothetical protein